MIVYKFKCNKCGEKTQAEKAKAVFIEGCPLCESNVAPSIVTCLFALSIVYWERERRMEEVKCPICDSEKCNPFNCPLFIRRCINEFIEEYFRVPNKEELDIWMNLKIKRITQRTF